MAGGAHAPNVDHQGPVPVSCCPPYAKVPSGELISEDFLTKCLPDAGAAQVTSFRVDEASLLVGRHSTTFRLLLDWSLPPTENSKPAGVSAAAAAAVEHTQDTVHADGERKAPRRADPVGSVFVKRMTCRELPPRSLIKWRTSIASYRAEATFFKTMASSASHSAALGAIIPLAFWVHVDDRLGDGGRGATGGATADCGGPGADDEEGVIKGLQESCFMMITEDLGAGWEQRNPEDLEGLEREYQNLLARFRPLLPSSWFESPQRPGGEGDGGGGGEGAGGVMSLGRRLAARALDLDAAVLGREGRESSLSRGGDVGGMADKGGGRGRTLVHGDLKTWNVFLRKGAWGEVGEEGTDGGGRDGDGKSLTAPAGGRVKIIDWQWCGEGLAAADVAYVMCTSLEPAVLLSKERELLDHYHAELSRGLEARFGKPVAEEGAGRGENTGSSWYPMEQLEDDYRVAFLDYMRCVVGTLWKGLTPEKMEKNRTSGPGLSLINRSIQHMQWMIERATRLLDELDDLGEEK
eukprot:g16019.t1